MANSRSRLGYYCPHQLIQSAPAQTGRPMLNIIPALGHKGRCKKATCRSLARATARVSKISNVLFPPQSRLQSTRSRRFPRFSCGNDIRFPSRSLHPLTNGHPPFSLSSGEAHHYRTHVTSVTDNVAKLIDSSITARLFVPKLPPPGLVGAKTSVGSPEACGTVGRAIATLCRIDGVPTNSDGSNLAPIKTAEHTSQVDVLITFYKE